MVKVVLKNLRDGSFIMKVFYMLEKSLLKRRNMVGKLIYRNINKGKNFINVNKKSS